MKLELHANSRRFLPSRFRLAVSPCRKQRSTGTSVSLAWPNNTVTNGFVHRSHRQESVRQSSRQPSALPSPTSALIAHGLLSASSSRLGSQGSYRSRYLEEHIRPGPKFLASQSAGISTPNEIFGMDRFTVSSSVCRYNGAHLSSFLSNFHRLLIIPQTYELRMSQVIALRPFGEFYVGHYFRFEPCDAFHYFCCYSLPSSRVLWFWKIGKGTQRGLRLLKLSATWRRNAGVKPVLIFAMKIRSLPS
jgi:hypothetical protein